ncbi:MAG: hypothetical protein HRU28_13315 [Rhizobiales bacterium]|nr:hypothetical protein [Hyphomicrobiales bacterium]
MTNRKQSILVGETLSDDELLELLHNNGVEVWVECPECNVLLGQDKNLDVDTCDNCEENQYD